MINTIRRFLIKHDPFLKPPVISENLHQPIGKAKHFPESEPIGGEERMTDTPQLTHEQVAEITQLHENFLNQLESLAISAIAFGDWSEVYDYINFHAPETDD